jgi:hypothetical protein
MPVDLPRYLREVVRVDALVAADVVEDVVRVLRLRPPDLSWVQRWSTPVEVVCELCAHVARLRRGDLSGVDELRLIFAPTGALQEIALSGGWGERYLVLAQRFDTAVTG